MIGTYGGHGIEEHSAASVYRSPTAGELAPNATRGRAMMRCWPRCATRARSCGQSTIRGGLGKGVTDGHAHKPRSAAMQCNIYT
jgi:hypothetical protein